MPQSPAIQVHVVRGPRTESLHRVDAVVCDSRGRIVRAWGEAERIHFPRSSIKSLQALPLVESGVADKLGLTDEQIAIACASHNSEPCHIEAVYEWLAKIGLGEHHLCCGGHFPYNEEAARILIRQHRVPGPI